MNRTALYRLTGLLLAGTMLSVPFAAEAADIRVQTLNIPPSIPRVAAPPPSITSRIALPPSRLRIPDAKSGGTKKIVKSPVKTGKTKTVTATPTIKDGKVKGAAQTTSKKDATFTGKANFKATATAKVVKKDPKAIGQVKYTATVKAGGMVVPRGNSTGSGHASAQPYDEFREANAPAGGNLAVATMKIDEAPLLRNAGVGFALADTLGALETAGLGAPGDIFGAWNPDGSPAFSVRLPDKDHQEGLSPAGIEDPREAGPTFTGSTGTWQPGAQGNTAGAGYALGVLGQPHHGGGGNGTIEGANDGRLMLDGTMTFRLDGSVWQQTKYDNGVVVTAEFTPSGNFAGGTVTFPDGQVFNLSPGENGEVEVLELDIKPACDPNDPDCVTESNAVAAEMPPEIAKYFTLPAHNGNTRGSAIASFITREQNGQPAPHETSDTNPWGHGGTWWQSGTPGYMHNGVDCRVATCNGSNDPAFGNRAPGGGMASVYARLVSVTNPAPRN